MTHNNRNCRRRERPLFVYCYLEQVARKRCLTVFNFKLLGIPAIFYEMP